jgi:AcrR family transcriptional regulator
MAKKKIVRKKPQQVRSKVIFESIIEAAALLLNEQGLKGFTTNKIAAKAGVSIGSLYRYFLNKEVILEKIMLEIVTRFKFELQSQADNLNSKTPEDFLEKHLTASWESCQKQALLIRAIYQAEKSDVLTRHIYLTRWELIENIQQDYQKRFPLKKRQEEFKIFLFTITQSYMGLVEALAFQETDAKSKAGGREVPLEKVLEGLIRLSQKGLKDFT